MHTPMHRTPAPVPRLLRRTLLLGTMLTAAALLGACASPAPAQSDEQALLQRAREYWQLVQQNDKIKAWPYEAASKDPNASFEGYVKRGGITFHAVEVQGLHSRQQDQARITIHQRYSLPLVRLNNQETTVQDHWRWIDGQWYHSPPPSIVLPSNMPAEEPN